MSREYNLIYFPRGEVCVFLEIGVLGQSDYESLG